MTGTRLPSPPQALRQRWLVPGSLAVVVLTLDQLTKYWIVRVLGPVPASNQIPVIDGWVSLIYVQNTGIAFGLFRNLSPIFTITSLVIGAGVIYAYMFYLPNHTIWVKLCTGLILGGALGNVIDRIRLSYVVDFIKIGWWPTFNIADSCISVGVVILALYLLFAEDGEPARPRYEDDAFLSELLSHEVGSREHEQC